MQAGYQRIASIVAQSAAQLAKVPSAVSSMREVREGMLDQQRKPNSGHRDQRDVRHGAPYCRNTADTRDQSKNAEQLAAAASR